MGRLNCCVLPDACIDILPNPNWKEQWLGGIHRGKAAKQFRLHVAGVAADTMVSTQAKCGIHEPLLPTFMRHLERDMVHEPDSAAMRRDRRQAGTDLTMMWPTWENGYGDPLAHTLLPLGDLLRQGRMPRNLAVSGLKMASLVEPLLAAAPGACAFERADPSSRLRRCEGGCYDRVSVCTTNDQQTSEAWEARAALDTAAGWRNRSTERAAGVPLDGGSKQGGGRALPRDMVVILAVREPHGGHSRVVVNQEEVLRACNGARLVVTRPDGRRVRTRLRCELLMGSAPTRDKVAALQRADVFVTMWGGDTINALHMRRGGIVLEMVPEAFNRFGPQGWVHQHAMWVTRSFAARQARLGRRAAPRSDAAELPGRIRYKEVELPASLGVVTDQTRKCVHMSHKKSWQRARRQNRTALTPAEQASWNCVWNADTRVEWAVVQRALESML